MHCLGNSMDAFSLSSFDFVFAHFLSYFIFAFSLSSFISVYDLFLFISSLPFHFSLCLCPFSFVIPKGNSQFIPGHHNISLAGLEI